MTRKLFLILRGRLLPAGALVVVLFLAACGEGRNKYEPPPPPRVTVAHPIIKPVTNYLDLTGSASAVATVDLVARVPGYLEKVAFKDGSVVDKGSLLFVIEPSSYEANLRMFDQARQMASSLLGLLRR